MANDRAPGRTIDKLFASVEETVDRLINVYVDGHGPKAALKRILSVLVPISSAQNQLLPWRPMDFKLSMSNQWEIEVQKDFAILLRYTTVEYATPMSMASHA